LITQIIFGVQCKYEAPHCAVFFRLLFLLPLGTKQPAARQTMLNQMTASFLWMLSVLSDSVLTDKHRFRHAHFSSNYTTWTSADTNNAQNIMICLSRVSWGVPVALTLICCTDWRSVHSDGVRGLGTSAGTAKCGRKHVLAKWQHLGKSSNLQKTWKECGI
jgi:hypothetical protein